MRSDRLMFLVLIVCGLMLYTIVGTWDYKYEIEQENAALKAQIAKMNGDKDAICKGYLQRRYKTTKGTT